MIEVRTPTADEYEPMCRVDGRSFGFAYTDEDMERNRSIIELDRFRIAVERGAIVGVAGMFSLEMTVPGGATLPTGGLTWVSVAVTHRRQGLLRRLMDAMHADSAARDEPLAALFAADSGIYERFGYGIASSIWKTSLDRRHATLRGGIVDGAHDVRFVDAAEARTCLPPIFDRARRRRPGEVGRTDGWWDFLMWWRGRTVGELSPAFHLVHPDGYVSYRVEGHSDNGLHANRVEVVEHCVATDAAHAALWSVLLGTDLAGPITSSMLPVDDPLPSLLTSSRLLSTVGLQDGLWLRPADIRRCFAARTYQQDDRLVLEVDGRRYAIEGGPYGATCVRVRTRADLVVDGSTAGALLLGGVSPYRLASGRRLVARDDAALRRAAAFFPSERAPSCSTHF